MKYWFIPLALGIFILIRIKRMQRRVITNN
jgi:hypothetical protein